MAAINFPSSPQVNDTVVADEVTYIWDGEKWKANTYVPESVTEVLVTKQDTLVSGTNIKTVNSTSLLGSGDVAVQPTLVSGTNIKTINGNSLLGSGNITISSGSSTATAVTTTATFTNSNFKIPFTSTTGNNSGDFTYNIDNGSNFTYNPNTNTLNSIQLGTSVSIPNSIIPASQRYALGGVYGVTSTGGTVSIGYDSGSSGGDSTSVGFGALAQGYRSSSFGYSANATGNGSVCIGWGTQDNYNNNSIILNANTSGFSAGSNGSGFYVNPITQETSSNVLYYNESTKKITYGTPSGGAIENLTNVSITSPTSGQVLTYNGTVWVNADAGGGGEEPPAADIYRSTKIVPTGASRQNSYSVAVSFSTATEANQVRLLLRAVGETYNNSNPEITFLAANSGYSKRININSNFWSYSSVSGNTLFIDNYYVDEPFNSNNYSGIDVKIYRSASFVPGPGPTGATKILLTPSPDHTAFVNGTTSGFNGWYPYEFYVYGGNNFSNIIKFQPDPYTSPTLGPAISNVSVDPGGALFFDLSSTHTQTTPAVGDAFFPQTNLTYIVMKLGKTELVDPNAPVPWYTVVNSMQAPLPAEIPMPSVYDGSIASLNYRFVGMGNFHNYSGGQNYFYPSNVAGVQGAGAFGNVFSNNRTDVYYSDSTSPRAPSTISSSNQGSGIAAVWATPLPSRNTSLWGPTWSNWNSTFDSVWNSTNSSITPPSGGSVVYKAVLIFNSNVGVTIHPAYEGAPQTLLEEFTYIDQYYYGTTTKYVFFTCTHDQTARAMHSSGAPVLYFGGSNQSYMGISWWEHTA